MKRFSKMLALGFAAALVLGMTVQAAGSPSAGDNDSKNEVLKNEASVSNTVVVDGQEVNVTFEAPEALAPEVLTVTEQKVAETATVTKVQDEIKKSVGSNETVTFVGEPKVAAAFEVKAPQGLTAEQISKGVKVSFELKGGIKANMKYVVVHFDANGNPEVLPTEVKDGKVWGTFTSFSPVVILEQEVKVDTNNGNNNNNSGNDSQTEQSPATSPKTGEAFPVAGVMALVLVAGAAVCAGKARYNR